MKKTRILAMTLAASMLMVPSAAFAEEEADDETLSPEVQAALDGISSATFTEDWTAEEEGYALWAVEHGFVYKPEENGYTKNDSEGVDALSSATTSKVGGVNYGAIEWDEELQEAAIKEFLKGGTYVGDPAFYQDETGNNYREMYMMATCYNNIPNNTNLELVMDADNFHLLGVSEAGTSKVEEFLLNPNVSINWVRQLRTEEEETYNYYCSYGVQINGTVRVYTADDLETEEGQDALINLFDKYYPTLASTWAAYSAGFAGLTDEAEIRDAKLAYISNLINGGASVVYEVIPTRIVITAPFLMNMSPTMANAAQFTQQQDGDQKYAYTLCLSDEFLDKLVDYKASVIATEEGQAMVEEYYTTGMYPMLDQYCAQYGAPTSLDLALIPTNAAGLKTQTTYIPGQTDEETEEAAEGEAEEVTEEAAEDAQETADEELTDLIEEAETIDEIEPVEGAEEVSVEAAQ